MMPGGNTSIDSLTGAFGDLRRALDSQDAAAINSATRALKAATDDARAHGAWHMTPELKEKLTALLPKMESARVRVNLASDDVRRRIAMLGDNGANNASLTYGR